MYTNAKINQPTINIGMIGSVSNGKSTVTEKVTGVKTQKHSKELERNITMKLGYANAKIFKCNSCLPPQCYQPHHSLIISIECKFCGEEMELVKHISLIDSPGHASLMATMMNGTCIMDTTILVESASNIEPTQQSKEHLFAINMTGLETKITCLNKVDLVKKDVAIERINSLKHFLVGTMAENSFMIPVAANYGINIDVLCEYICKYIDEPLRDYNCKLKMVIIRSFNINKPNSPCEKLEGGVIGGSIVEGVVHLNDKIIIYPGFVTKNETDSKCTWSYKPLIGTVMSINSETNSLEYAIPGGLIGMKLDIDPGLATNDGLVGNIVTSYDNINSYFVYETVFIELELMNRLDRVECGVLTKKDMLIINSNACNSRCEVVRIKTNRAELKLLDKPICVKINEYITLSKSIGCNIIVIGRAKIIKGIESLRK